MSARNQLMAISICFAFASTTVQARAQATVGSEIIGNGQGGPAAEIISNGTPGHPSVGMDVTTTGTPGQSVTGVRVIQNGPGTGLRVIQNGPGVGLRSTVIVGPADKLTH